MSRSTETVSERFNDSLQIAGGFAVIGAVATGAITLVGEVLDQAGAVSDFPGAKGAVVMGGLSCLAAVSLIVHNYLDR